MSYDPFFQVFWSYRPVSDIPFSSGDTFLKSSEEEIWLGISWESSTVDSQEVSTFFSPENDEFWHLHLRVSSVFDQDWWKRDFWESLLLNCVFWELFICPWTFQIFIQNICIYLDSTLLGTDSIINCIKTFFFPFSFKFPKGKVTGKCGCLSVNKPIYAQQTITR